jgi:phosphoadenosine phosphosulfate reductase
VTLIENTLFGITDKVQMAIDRLRNLEPAEGYYLAFSGGKDSVTIYRLAEMAGVKFDAHYNITTVDPPELVRFIRNQYPTVERHRPEMSMWELLRREKTPPLRLIRYCCRILKEGGGEGRMVVTGVRWAESARRAKRQMTEQCKQGSTKVFLHPIIDWTDSDVWAFIRGYGVPYCSLYDEGFKRLGCVLCPMASNTEAEMQRWPRIAAQYRRVFDQMYELRIVHNEERRRLGRKVHELTFTSGAEWFNWWIIRNAQKCSEPQPVMFE